MMKFWQRKSIKVHEMENNSIFELWNLLVLSYVLRVCDAYQLRAE